MKTTFCLLLVTALCLGVVNSQIIGQVEFASTELVRGWVCDLLLPSRTVTVTVQRDNGINLGSAQATVPRPDIAPRCNGKAATGFILRFSGANVAALSDNNPHTLRVLAQRAFFAGSVQLPGSPVVVSSAPLGLRGFLDVANSTSVAGWSCDPAHPNRNIQVRIFVDDSIFAGNTIANFNREAAVGQQCGGNSQHGFRFNFPQNIVNILSNGQPHTVSTFAIPREGGEQSGNPIQLSASPKTVQVFSGTPRGFLDVANTTVAAGWACDPLQPGQFLRVNFVLDGSTFAGSVLANQNREPAVGQQCGGNSQHGFTFQFPQNIINILNNGQSHSIAAFALPFPSGNPTELSNSPRTIPATTPSVPRGFLDAANVTFASGWACDPLRPTQSLTVNILIDGTISAGSVVANLNREAAVGQQCGGNSQHGWTIQFPPNIVNILSNGQTHTVAAFAVPFPTGTPTQLSNSPLNVLAPIVRGGIPVGFLDIANATFAAGWGCDPTLPNQFITVNILIDGSISAGSVVANLNREPAVGQQCGGNSQHGWTLQFSPNIVNLLSNGQSHTVAAFLVPVPTGTPVQASGSPKTVQVTLPSVPRGFLDSANATFASGWACDPLRPNQPLTVNIFVDGTIFAGTVIANLQREPAVGQQCGGNAQHGWTFQFPQNIRNILSNGQPHPVSAFAIAIPSGAPTQLTNSPITVVTVVRGGPPVGFLDVANATFAAGWACDPTLPNQFITVNIIVDGTIFAGSVTANLNREPAVGQQCGGNSQHGWTFNFPPNIVTILSNGQSHTVAAFMVPFPTGTAVQASGSPKTVQVILPSVPRGFLDSANATFASGWACDPVRPTQSLTVNIFVDGTIFAGSVVANLNREPAVGQQCGGNSQHGWTIQFPQNIINILSNGQPHPVSAFALPFPSGNPTQLTNSPITVVTVVRGGPPVGFLDSANATFAAGWACDPTLPNQFITVNIIVDGTIFAGSVTANLNREPAVGQQCGGNSQHGWTFNFPQNIVNILSNGQSHTVAAFMVPFPTGTAVQASGSPKTVQVILPSVPRGFLDSANATFASGWACDPVRPTQSLTVNIFVDGTTFAGSAVANLNREPAVGQQCGGNSQHGWTIQFPQNIINILSNGQPHTVSAFALPFPSGTPTQLSNSPITVITQRVFGIPRGFLDAASVNSASGWACDPLNPSDPLTVTFLIDGSINAGSVPAGNLREAAVGQQCGGNSAHGFTFNFPQNIVNILNDGNTHTVAAFTTSGPNQIQLSQSPRTVQGTAPVVPPRGFLDVASTTRAAGWACDPTNFNQPLTIVFVIDGSISGGQTTANLPRESAVGDQCGGISSRGFDFTWPANIQQILQSGSHTVSAFALDVPTGNQQQLSNSPQTVTGF